jgi:hypothetical protein
MAFATAYLLGLRQNHYRISDWSSYCAECSSILAQGPALTGPSRARDTALPDDGAGKVRHAVGILQRSTCRGAVKPEEASPLPEGALLA